MSPPVTALQCGCPPLTFLTPKGNFVSLCDLHCICTQPPASFLAGCHQAAPSLPCPPRPPTAPTKGRRTSVPACPQLKVFSGHPPPGRPPARGPGLGNVFCMPIVSLAPTSEAPGEQRPQLSSLLNDCPQLTDGTEMSMVGFQPPELAN